MATKHECGVIYPVPKEIIENPCYHRLMAKAKELGARVKERRGVDQTTATLRFPNQKALNAWKKCCGLPYMGKYPPFEIVPSQPPIRA